MTPSKSFPRELLADAWHALAMHAWRRGYEPGELIARLNCVLTAAECTAAARRCPQCRRARFRIV